MAQQTAVQWLLSELQIRLLKIKSEPDGIVRERMINSFLIDAEQAEAMEKEQRGYTKQEFLNAAQLGEVSMIDARHIVSLLDEARDLNNK